MRKIAEKVQCYDYSTEKELRLMPRLMKALYPIQKRLSGNVHNLVMSAKARAFQEIVAADGKVVLRVYERQAKKFSTRQHYNMLTKFIELLDCSPRAQQGVWIRLIALSLSKLEGNARLKSDVHQFVSQYLRAFFAERLIATPYGQLNIIDNRLHFELINQLLQAGVGYSADLLEVVLAPQVLANWRRADFRSSQVEEAYYESVFGICAFWLTKGTEVEDNSAAAAAAAGAGAAATIKTANKCPGMTTGVRSVIPNTKNPSIRKLYSGTAWGYALLEDTQAPEEESAKGAALIRKLKEANAPKGAKLAANVRPDGWDDLSAAVGGRRSGHVPEDESDSDSDGYSDLEDDLVVDEPEENNSISTLPGFSEDDTKTIASMLTRYSDFNTRNAVAETSRLFKAGHHQVSMRERTQGAMFIVNVATEDYLEKCKLALDEGLNIVVRMTDIQQLSRVNEVIANVKAANSNEESGGAAAAAAAGATESSRARGKIKGLDFSAIPFDQANKYKILELISQTRYSLKSLKLGDISVPVEPTGARRNMSIEAPSLKNLSMGNIMCDPGHPGIFCYELKKLTYGTIFCDIEIDIPSELESLTLGDISQEVAVTFINFTEIGSLKVLKLGDVMSEVTLPHEMKHLETLSFGRLIADLMVKDFKLYPKLQEVTTPTLTLRGDDIALLKKPQKDSEE